MVNRIWQYHFGRGIVATPNDFGRMGARPTHPELLDYLAKNSSPAASAFKHVHRLILLSSTYQQSSDAPLTGRGLAAERSGEHAALAVQSPAARGRGDPRRDAGRLRQL